MSYSFSGAVKIEGRKLVSATGGQVRIDLSEIPKGHYKLYANVKSLPIEVILQFGKDRKTG